MKKLGKVLRILLAVLMVLVLLFCAYIFFVLNHHFLVDMRSLAPVTNRYSQRLIQVEDGVKFIVDDGYVVLFFQPFTVRMAFEIAVSFGLSTKDFVRTPESPI